MQGSELKNKAEQREKKYARRLLGPLTNYRRALAVLLAMAVFCPANPTALAGRLSKDRLGREVMLPDNPRRVVALAPSITEIIYALGLEKHLVGATLYSDYPARALGLPRVGSYVNLDLEKIVALKPDLCIAIKDGNPKAIIDRLEDLKIPVYAVDPRNLDSVMDTIVSLGRLFNARQRADLLVRGMSFRIQRVKQTLVDLEHRPGVFFQIGVAPIVSVGTNTFIHELIVLAGGENLAAGSVPYPRYNWEHLLALAPEIIIITSMTKAAVFEQVKAQWDQWPQIPAVRDQRVYIENSDLFDRPSPRLVDALEVLARLIHPERVGDGLK